MAMYGYVDAAIYIEAKRHQPGVLGASPERHPPENRYLGRLTAVTAV